ncbi:MAG: chorismate lyase, partial [Gammaproteobacteria bacterium]|nr:chorismate lyase [Gammaproteobacteria bacterium]
MGNSVPSRLREWLYEDRSLTARLKHLCPGKFSLRLLDQCLERPMQDERSCLQLPSGRSALIRQVQLLCDETPLVFARSVIPLTTLKGTQRQLAHLGTRPLADMLFASRTMQRSTMEF